MLVGKVGRVTRVFIAIKNSFCKEIQKKKKKTNKKKNKKKTTTTKTTKIIK